MFTRRIFALTRKSVAALVVATFMATMMIQSADAKKRSTKIIKGTAIGAGVGALVGGGSGAKKGAVAGAIVGAVK